MCTKLLPRDGVDATLVDPHDVDAVAAALPGASLFYVETIANPNVTVVDLGGLGAICRSAGVPAAVDNTFATPVLCTPAALGFEYELHARKEYLGGPHEPVGGGGRGRPRAGAPRRGDAI